MEEVIEHPEVKNEQVAEAPEEQHDEVVVTIGDGTPPEETEQAPEWVRDLRKKNREDQKRIRELEEQLKAAAPEKKATLGAKPKLEELDYDTEAYETALATWYDQKRIADEQEARIREESETTERAWQNKIKSYGDSKAEIKVADFDEAEEAVQNVLSKTQQAIIMQGAKNPALLVYAIGKNPAKAKELAAITDPVQYAFAVAQLETQLKITPRKAPPPEKQISGGGAGAGISGTVDSTLERLRAEAEKSGDYSKVVQYKQSKRK